MSRTRFVVAVVGVFPILGKLVEEIGEMIQHPVPPARRDVRVWRDNPFTKGAHTRSVRGQPQNTAACHDLDGGACFVEQRGILDGALSATDHKDVPSLEAAEVAVVRRM